MKKTKKKTKKTGISKIFEVLDQDFKLVNIKIKGKTITIEMEEN